MALSNDYSLSDIAAVTGNNGKSNDGWGGDWSSWIIVFLIFAIFGGFGNRGGGFFGGGSPNGGGVADNYVITSDFSQLSRQMSDGFSSQERKLDSITNGLCDGFYTQAQLINGVNMNIAQNGYESRLATTNLGSQLASCCCDIREGISGVNYNMAMNTNALQRQIADSSCATQRQIERGFADTNYNLATQNCATLTAIDKVGDRIIDYISNEKMQALRDENQALRLAASQARQNEYLVDRLGYQCPKPAYVVQPPQNVTFPTNCCGSVNFANGGCGCNG